MNWLDIVSEHDEMTLSLPNPSSSFRFVSVSSHDCSLCLVSEKMQLRFEFWVFDFGVYSISKSNQIKSKPIICFCLKGNHLFLINFQSFSRTEFLSKLCDSKWFGGMRNSILHFLFWFPYLKFLELNSDESCAIIYDLVYFSLQSPALDS